jgi:hypothetical protein
MYCMEKILVDVEYDTPEYQVRVRVRGSVGACLRVSLRLRLCSHCMRRACGRQCAW